MLGHATPLTSWSQDQKTHAETWNTLGSTPAWSSRKERVWASSCYLARRWCGRHFRIAVRIAGRCSKACSIREGFSGCNKTSLSVPILSSQLARVFDSRSSELVLSFFFPLTGGLSGIPARHCDAVRKCSFGIPSACVALANSGAFPGAHSNFVI